MSDYRSEFYRQYVSSFKAETQRFDRAGYDLAAGKLHALIGDWLAGIPKDAPCLDLGCGHGPMLWYWKSLGFSNTRGVDVSAEQVEIARANELPAQARDIFEFLKAEPDGSCQLVTAFDVLEHLTKGEALELVRQIGRIVRPGGRVIFHCPNGESPFAGAIRYGDYTHELALTPSSAANLLKINGFGGVEARENGGFSRGLSGRCRRAAWGLLRRMYALANLIETGSSGSGVYTRCFAFTGTKR